MKAPLSLAALGLAFLALAGCKPDERFWWSPGGDRAVVEVDDQLHLVEAGGELGEPLPLADTVDDSISSVDWLPDGSAIAVCRKRAVKTWAETKALIPEEDAKRVELLLPSVIPLLERLVELRAQKADLDALVEQLQPLPDPCGIAALILAHEQSPEQVSSLLRRLTEDDDDEGWIETARYEVSELLRVDLGQTGAPKVTPLQRSLPDRFLRAVCSPDGAWVAVSRVHDVLDLAGDSDAPVPTVEIVSSTDGTRLTRSHPCSEAFDWTPDGQSLVMASPMVVGVGKWHLIRKLRIPPPGAEDSEDVTALFHAVLPDPPHLEVLPDGSVLFAALELSSPSPAKAPPTSLFRLSPDGSTMTKLPIGTDAFDPTFFRSSPDGRRVAVVDPGSDAVWVVDLASGETRAVSPAHTGWKCRTVPAWKSPTELGFAALPEPGAPPAWMLWSDAGETQCLSKGWPAAATGSWLEKESDPAQ